MVRACVLVRFQRAVGRDLLEKIRAMQGVEKAYFSLGRYDAIVFLNAGSHTALVRTAMRLNAVRGVKSTETLLEV